MILATAFFLLIQSSTPASSVDPIPLKPGTAWIYRETWREDRGGLDEVTVSETRFEVRPGRRPFLRQSGGEDPASGPAESGPGWLRLPPWTGEDALPLPLEPGGEGPVAEGSSSRWICSDFEEVSVPAGEFQALACGFSADGREARLWIALGVGVVRETEGPRGRRPDLERVLLRLEQPGSSEVLY